MVNLLILLKSSKSFKTIKVEMSVRKVPISGFRARGRSSRGRGFSRGVRGSGGPPRDGDWACES